MIFPIADTPNPPGRPLVTWLLLGGNIAVYLLVTLPATMGTVNLNDPLLLEYLRVLGVQGPVSAREVYANISPYDLLVFDYGFRPGDFSLVTMFSSMFLHGGLMHLAGNMLFLFIFGDNVENRLGSLRFLIVYLACGVAATLFFALFVPGSQVPLIGASGAISGVLGCYFLWFPRNRVRCFVFLFPILVTTIYLSARLVLGFYLFIDNILPFLFTATSNSGVAHGAHIGGFLGGLGIAFGLDRYYQQAHAWRPPSSPAVINLGWVRRACPTLPNDDLAAASDCYLSLDDLQARRQIDSAAVLAIGNHLLGQGRSQEALQVFRRFIAERPNDLRIDQAHLGAGKALLEQPRTITSAYHYFLAALDLARSEQLAAEAKLQLRAIERAGALPKG